MLLKDRVVLITGAGRGIGKAIAERFAGEGATLVLNSKTETVLQVAAQLQAQGIVVLAVQGDITDDRLQRELIQLIRKEFGRLDILVNNAGIFKQAALGMMTRDEIQRIFETNIIAAITLTQYAVRLMKAPPTPSIINLSSVAGTQGLNGLSTYGASKAAIVGFTLSLAKELAPRGIRVNALAPGLIDTDLTHNGISPEILERTVGNILLGRMGTASEVASCALFLASDLSSYITGQIIDVNGGMIA